MTQLAWAFRRLRAMDAREIGWRARKQAQRRLPLTLPRKSVADLGKSSSRTDWTDLLERFSQCKDRPVLLDRERAHLLLAQRPNYVSELIEIAAKAADLTVWFPGFPKVTLTSPVDWNHDPISGTHYPSIASKSINYRRFPANLGWIWRINRLQHLPWLAQAWLFTGDNRYCEAAFEHLDSWIDQNPAGRGIAWNGPLEIALRAISISTAVQGLRDSPELTSERFSRIVRALADSAQHCWAERSLFSSANNHLVGEMAGVAVVAIMFPELDCSTTWERNAIQALVAEASRQMLSDGVGAEQSIAYQMFTAELLHIVTVLLIQRDGAAPEPLVDALRRSTSFLAALVAEGDPPLRFGDNDEGFALRLDGEAARTVHHHIGMMNASGFAPSGVDVGADSLAAQWFRLAAESSPAASAKMKSSSAPPVYGRSFIARDGGHVILRSQNRRFHMDVGPLGYLSTAAHGHADALALTLSIDGHEIISDPGTGSYYGSPDWRRVARGTRAHATVCVDREDQSLAGGPYLWLKHAKVRDFGADLDFGIVDAQHDGYSRLRGGVIHRRWLVAPARETTQLIIDLITGVGVHECEQNWPLHPSLDIQMTAAGYLLSRSGSPELALHQAASLPITFEAVRGDQGTNTGWWADPRGGRMPAWWLRARCFGALPVAMMTLLSPPDMKITGTSVVLSEDHIDVLWKEGGSERAIRADINNLKTVLLDGLPLVRTET